MKAQFKLRANWSKKEKDIIVNYPLGVGTKRDCNYLFHKCFNNEFVEEMSSRGYDIESLKFEISIKKGARLDKFETLNKQLINP